MQLAVLVMMWKLLEYIVIENWKRDVGQLKTFVIFSFEKVVSKVQLVFFLLKKNNNDHLLLESTCFLSVIYFS